MEAPPDVPAGLPEPAPPPDDSNRSTWFDRLLSGLLVFLFVLLIADRMGYPARDVVRSAHAMWKRVRTSDGSWTFGPPTLSGGQTPAERETIKNYNASSVGWRSAMDGGRYADALSAADLVVALRPEHLTPEARAAAHLMKGQALTALDRPGEAIGAIEAARSIKSGPSVYVAMASAYFKREDYGQALGYLRDYMDSGGALSPQVYYMLGACYDRTGAAEQAADWVQRGVREFPNDAPLAKLAERYARHAQAERGMSTQYGEHFTLKFVDLHDQVEIRREVESALEAAYRQVSSDLGYRDDRPVPVIIYPNSSTYVAASGVPLWTAAHYDGKIRVPIGRNNDRAALGRICTHEFTHAVISRITKDNCPTWLNEGLAQLEERSNTSWMSARLSGSARLSVAELSDSFIRFSDPALAELAYAQSYQMTYDLVNRAGLGRVREALIGLGQGRSLYDTLPEAPR